MATDSRPAGRTEWFVPDGFIPTETKMTSHESICLLNVGDVDAQVVFGAYFEGREPEFSDPVPVPGRRAMHLRTDDPDRVGGLRIPAGVPYALTVTSDVPVLAQYSRLDTTDGAYTLITTIPDGRI